MTSLRVMGRRSAGSVIVAATSVPPVGRLVRNFDERRRSAWAGRLAFDAAASRSVWLFSQMKSGSTLACNLVAFYRSLQLGIELDFDSIEAAGVIRLTGKNGTRALTSMFDAGADIGSRRYLIHTHSLPGESATDRILPSRIFLQTREPFDYCVSAYHYNFRNRRSKQSVAMADALKAVADEYATVHLKQQEIQSLRPDSIVLRYEDLVEDTPSCLVSLLTATGDEIDSAHVTEAVRLTSPEHLADFEAERGRALGRRCELHSSTLHPLWQGRGGSRCPL